MSYKTFEQFEPHMRPRGRRHRSGYTKYSKRKRNKWLRQKMKNIDFVPLLNRYYGWEY